MRIAKEHIELFNKQIQDLSGVASVRGEPTGADSNGPLFEEFSRIMDKIAAKVQTLQVNQADSDLTANSETIAAKVERPVSTRVPEVTASDRPEADKEPAPTKDNMRALPLADNNHQAAISVAKNSENSQVAAVSQQQSVEHQAKSSEQGTEDAADKNQDEQQTESVEIVDEELVVDQSAEVVAPELVAANEQSAELSTDQQVIYAAPLQAETKPADTEANISAETVADDVEPELYGDATAFEDVVSSEQPVVAKTQVGEKAELSQKPATTAAPEVVQDLALAEVSAAPETNLQKVPVLPDQFAQKIIERLLEKFAAPQYDVLKVDNAVEQFARLAVELSLPIKVNQQVLSTALNITQTTEKSGNEAGQAIRAISASSTGSNSFNGAQTQQNQASRAPEQQAETQRLPRSFASRTLTRVEEALKEVARSKDGKTISLRLDPPSLGSVRIDVRISDGVLTAKLRADNPQVLNLLREHGFDLQSTLRRLGLVVDQIKVAVSSDPQTGDQQFKEFFNGNQTNRDSQQSSWAQEQLAEEVFNVVNDQVETNTVVDHWVA